MKLNRNSDKIVIEGHLGKWYVIDTTFFNEENLFLLEHETWGDEVACLIVDEDRHIILEDVWNGFDDLEDLE